MKTGSRDSAARIKPAVLVIGSSNTDLIIKLARLPQPGETILGGEFGHAAGGKGANQAVAAARAGGAVTFLACVGRDANDAAALAGFAADGINVKHVTRHPTRPSGVALILVDRKGENCIAVAAGANDQLSPAAVRQAKQAFRRTQIVLLQLETPLPTIMAAAQLAAAAGARLVLNPGIHWRPPFPATNAPRAPIVMMTFWTPRARSRSAARAAVTASATTTPVSRSASPALGVRR